MKGEWRAILARYGKKVRVLAPDGGVQEVKVLLQPQLARKTQLQPSPLGLRREERAMCFGPGELELLPGQTVVEDGQVRYEVRAARLVGDGHHLWAMLQRMEDMP